MLRTWYELIMANQEDLARLLSWEQGKPLAESRGEIVEGAIGSKFRNSGRWHRCSALIPN